MKKSTNDTMPKQVGEVYELLDKFLDIAKNTAHKHPAIVVILMHEYFRNLYPDDPFIKQKYAVNVLTNIKHCLLNNIKILESFKKVGSYYGNNVSLNEKDIKSDGNTNRMDSLFGALWRERYNDKMLNSKKVIVDLFKANGLNLRKLVKDKNVIDIGCGSGRFAIAIAQLGAKKVTAIDISKQGLEIAKKFAKSLDIKNLKLVKHDILNLPFKDSTYDFTFSKGVLHHTGNLERGINEYSRVLKKRGTGFLYLYANGGIYWNSRRKMRKVMKKIPMNYAINVLNSIGMPSRRTIFVDSWYVPIEEYVTSKYIEKKFIDLGYEQIIRLKSHRTFELDKIVLENNSWAKHIWGEGELRYFLKK